MENTLFNSTSLLEVRTYRGNKLFKPSEIIYLEGNNKYSMIHLYNKEKVKTNHLLKWYEGRLESLFFLRCHASFIVNSEFIDFICGNNFILKGDIFVPISRRRKKKVLYDYKLFKVSITHYKDTSFS